MNLVRWEPLNELVTLRQAMDRLFEDSFVRPGPRWVQGSEYHCELPIDVYTTDEEVVLVASVPGMSPEDVEITIEGDSITLKGDVPAPMANVEYAAQERPYGKFARTLRINVPVQADKAEATFEKGVLTLVIPKQEEVKPRTIKVTGKTS